MKNRMIVKKWQLLRFKAKEQHVDLSDADFVAVGNDAFYENQVVETVALPQSVAAVKTESFYNCKHLYAVTLPSERTVGISKGAFLECTRLRELNHAERISAIGDRAFEGCYMLPNLTLGVDLKRIGEYAFKGCASMTEVALPGSITALGKGAFMDCTELERVETEEPTALLAKDLFRNCISLREIQLSAMIREFPAGVFRGCSALREFHVPGHVSKIGARAFYGCSRLQNAELELGVTHVGAFAFANAPQLESVTVPHTLKRLSFGAFGLGFSKEKIKIFVDNEYMKRRIQNQLRLCLSFGRAEVLVVGKSIEERKRERRRSSLDQEPTHLI